VSELCDVKPHVLRYWEQEFPQLKPVKRRGNRRYYQRQEVMTIRQIRSLLYEHGFTIGGARQRLTDEGTIVDESAEQVSCVGSRHDYRARRFVIDAFAAAPEIIFTIHRGVAQLGSALDWGSSGRRFKSSRPDQFNIQPHPRKSCNPA
jgi:DNA-binding transcriptional MerR regulator